MILPYIFLLSFFSIKGQIIQASGNNIQDSSYCVHLEKEFLKLKEINFLSAKAICDTAISIGQSLNNDFILEHWYRNMGHLFLIYQLNYPAVNYYGKGLAYAEKTGKINNWWYINIGNIYFADQDYAKAYKYYKLAFKYFKESINKNQGAAFDGMAVAYSNIGLIFLNKHQTDSALYYTKKSLEYRKKTNRKNSIVFSYNQLASIFLSAHIPDSANSYIDSAITISVKSANHAYLPEAYLIKYDILLKKGDKKQAEQKLNEGLEKTIRLNDPNGMLKIYTKLIENAKDKNDKEEAIYYINRALKLIDYPENKEYRADFFKKLAGIYSHFKITDLAYKYLKKYSKHTDSVHSNLFKVIQYLFENELNKSKLEVVQKDLETEQKLNKYYKITFTVGLFVFIFIMILLYVLIKKSAVLRRSLTKINEQKILFEKYKNDLEELVNEQMHDLIAAKEQAEQADRLKTAFLENLSHEVRTPLNAIIGFAEMLQYNSNLPENAMQYIDYIINAGEALLRNIDAIIQLSDIQANNHHLHISNFYAVRPIEKIIIEFKSSGKLKKSDRVEIRTKFNIDKELKISADEKVLSNILYHLIDNALKFTEKGYIEIGIEPYNENYLLYHVKDTGIGINQKDIKFVFDKFRKVNHEQSKLYRGLGMGLTIVKHLVESMSGEIWLESESNKGTIFYFTIPYHLEQ